MTDIKGIWDSRVKGSVLLSMFLSIWCVLSGRVLSDKGASFGIMTVFEMLILAVLFVFVIHIIKYVMNNIGNINIFHSIFQNKWFPYVFFIILILVWTYHIIVKYPSGNCIDSINQMSQAMGLKPYSAHHPIFHTLVLKFFLDIGEALGKIDYGLFLFSIVEALITAVIFSYVVKVMIDHEFPDIIVAGGCLFFMFSPYITGYLGQTIKDTYYAAFMVLFLTQITLYVLDNAVLKRISWYIILLISTCGCILERHNGIYVIFPTFVCIVIVEIIRKNVTLLLIIGLVLALLVPIVADKGLEKLTNAEKAKIRETLSLPMQQTARFVKYYPELVTDEEKEIISKVLPYDSLPKLYKEHISDPVKAKFNNDATMDEIIAYLKVWMKQFFRKPSCYFSATFRQNMYLLYPGYNNYKYYVSAVPADYVDNTPIKLKSPSKIVMLQKTYEAVLEDMHELPILRIINNMANYVLLFLILALLIINKKEKEKLILYLPIFMSVLIVIAAPVIRGHVRYIFPLIWSVPLWLGLSAINNSNEELGKNKKTK